MVDRRIDVDLASRTAARKHSNTVKQWERVRAAQCEDIRLGQLMAAKQRIRCPFFWHLLKAVAHKVERRPPIFFAVPAVPVVGLGRCSVAVAKPTILGSRTRTDGRDRVAERFQKLRKTV